MILPIVAFGDPVLRKKTTDITKDYPFLEALISNMFETMYNASGVGLAAPQIGKAIRLFIVDASPFDDYDDYSEDEQNYIKNFKKVFINAQIIEEIGDLWAFNEGCLSIPGVNEDVRRQPSITIKYLDENFEPQEETLTGVVARIVQHEYDHIEGILFTDKISSFKKRLVKGKLDKISKGQVKVDYPMTFPHAKR